MGSEDERKTREFPQEKKQKGTAFHKRANLYIGWLEQSNHFKHVERRGKTKRYRVTDKRKTRRDYRD